MMTGPVVLVVGGTGQLGRQVVTALQAAGKPVRALVRPGSDATVLEASGVEVVRGDMLDPRSLPPAFDEVDAVITSAVGYTRRRKTDTGATDVTGNHNLADAARVAAVRRYVFTGILRSDQAAGVSHFWNKVLAERALADRGVPYVSLRPAAFFDQVMDLLPGGGPRRARLITPIPTSVRQSYVLSGDVATALTALVDAPVADGEHIDLAWNRPVSMAEIAELTAEALGHPVRLFVLPQVLVRTAAGLVRRFSDQAEDLLAMVQFFASGRFIADTGPAERVLGDMPTPEAAIRRWAASPPLTRPRS